MNSSLYGSMGIIFYGPEREFKLTTIIQAIEVVLKYISASEVEKAELILETTKQNLESTK